MDKITIVVVDDHPLFRQGVIDTLSLQPDIVVVGQSANGTRGLEMIRAMKPQVAVVDVNLPSINGHQLTQQIITDKIPTRIILLTAYDDYEQKLLAFQVGAAAFCNKYVMPDTLVNTIRQVAAGMYCMGNEVIDERQVEHWLAQQTGKGAGEETESGEAIQPLSAREMEVLIYVTRGKSNKEIAAGLEISQQTVKNHITTILRKLGVEDRTQAAIYAIRRGWVRVYPDENDQE